MDKRLINPLTRGNDEYINAVTSFVDFVFAKSTRD